jgi:phage terminase large subunit-like protein
MSVAEAIPTTGIERLEEYVSDVLSGACVVGKLERLAVERHIRDLDEGEARGLDFDTDEAVIAIEFIECLRHSKGEWASQKIHLEPVQCFVVGSLFAWFKQNSEGQRVRRFNVGFVLWARKNGKSLLAAAIGHKLFVADGEEGAEVYSAGTKREQAKIVHEEAKRMVRSSPSLSRIVEVLRDNLSIPATNSKYEPLGADADTTDGLNISGAIIDELHAHKTRELWDVLDTATSARRNPLLFVITTAGIATDLESIYLELRHHSVQVLEGALDDDSWFAHIATLEEGDDWTDESVWPKANPLLGISVKIDDLRRKCRRAKNSPNAVMNFQRRHCNQDVEISASPWLDLGVWDLCRDELRQDCQPPTEETIERFRGKACAVGGDLSSVRDLTALVFSFPAEDGGLDIVPFCWCPRSNALGKQKDKRIPYLDWAEQGYLRLTEGDSVDYDELRHVLRTARDEWGWKIGKMAFDPNNARHLMTELVEEDGFPEDDVLEHIQTCGHMNEPIVTTEKAILDRRLRHGGNRVMAWCLSNIRVYQDTGGRRRFDKKKSRDRIDLPVAMVMAVWYSLETATSGVGIVML